MMLESCGKPSRGRYVQGCRCVACTRANNAYWHKREKDKAKERFGAKEEYWADAEPVRAHLRKLLSSGYTKRGICREYGISRSTMQALFSRHHRTGKPIERIKAETARRILEIGSHTSFVYYRNDQEDHAMPRLRIRRAGTAERQAIPQGVSGRLLVRILV